MFFRQFLRHFVVFDSATLRKDGFFNSLQDGFEIKIQKRCDQLGKGAKKILPVFTGR